MVVKKQMRGEEELVMEKQVMSFLGLLKYFMGIWLAASDQHQARNTNNNWKVLVHVIAQLNWSQIAEKKAKDVQLQLQC